MDDLTDDERTRMKASDLLTEYQKAVVMVLAQEIIRYEDDFRDTKTPLHGTVPAILEKYYGVLNSIFAARRALAGKCI
jgi:hypothetical protein